MKNKTSAYFLHLARQYRAFIILYFVLALAAFPVHAFSTLFLSRSVEDALPFYFSQAIEAQGMLAINMLGVSFLTPYIMFNFLFSRSSLDTYFSLPIRREKLFLQHFAFGFLMQAVPAVVAGLLGYGIIQAAYLAHGSLTGPLIASGHLTTYSFGSFALSMLLMVLGSLLLMMPSTLAILCTPNLFNAIIYGVVLELIPLILAYDWNQYVRNYFGYTSLSQFSGPYPIQFQMTYISAFNGGLNPAYIVHIAVGFLVGLLLLGLSVRLFRTRRVERTNTNEMVKGFYPFMITFFGIILLVMLMGMFYSALFEGEIWYKNSMLITLFLMAFALYFIIQIIRNHGIPKILMTVMSYVVIFLVSLLLAWGMHNVVRKGLVSASVNPSRVASLEISTATAGSPDGRQVYYPFGQNASVTSRLIKDPKVIADVIAWQKSLTSQALADNNITVEKSMFFVNPNVRLIYYSANGEILLARSYALNKDTSVQDLEAITGFKLDRPSAGHAEEPMEP